MRLIYTLILFLVAIQQAIACTCTSPPTVKKNWEWSNQVFLGQVESVSQFYTSYGTPVTASTIRILESFKSKHQEGTAMRTFISYGSGSCDFDFENGQKYLIYADENPDDSFLRSSYCLRTSLLSNVSENELEELRELNKNTTTLKEHNTGAPKLDVYRQLEDQERELTTLRELQGQSTHIFSLFVYVGSAIITIL
ncbi:hypothetical protein, partial [Pontibacter sp. H249]|uniref:hypothetical protein n=1 Tax=Pontibacter sp. H249 TaxID=3133420 RepID=UPI0030C1833C